MVYAAIPSAVVGLLSGGIGRSVLRDLGATGWLLIGSVPGVLIGGRLTLKLPDRALRIALAATLTLSGVKLLDPPGSDAIVAAGAAVAAVVAVVQAARWLAGRGAASAPDVS